MRSLEPLPPTVQVRGISKSAVSERFVYGTERKLAELMSRDLRGLALVALLIEPGLGRDRPSSALIPRSRRPGKVSRLEHGGT